MKDLKIWEIINFIILENNFYPILIKYKFIDML